MNQDSEKKEMTIVPERTIMSLAANGFMLIDGVIIILLYLYSSLFETELNIPILGALFLAPFALAIIIFSSRNLYRFFLIPYYTITLKHDSVVFANIKTGEVEKVIKAADIKCVTYRDLVIIPRKLTLTHRNDRICVRDYTRGRTGLIFQSDLSYSDIIGDIKINRMAFDDEKGITITPDQSRVFSLVVILLLGIYGAIIIILGMGIVFEEQSFRSIIGLFSSLIGLVYVAIALISVYKLLSASDLTIIVKNDSLVFKNPKTGIERSITPLDIERSLFHKSVIILLKNGQKEIIGIKDYTKGKFNIIQDVNSQNVLSKRILTFIAENYEHVFVPDFLLTLGVPVDVQDLVNPINHV